MAGENSNEQVSASAPGEGSAPAADAVGNQAEAGSTKKSERELYLESEAKRAIQERDEAKRQLRQAEEKRLAEDAKFKELWEKNAPELEQLRKEKAEREAAIKGELTEAEKSLSPEEKAEYDSFIAKLPEGDRLKWITARKARTERPPSSSPGSGSRPASGEKAISQAKFDGMTPFERAQFFASGGTISG